MKKILFVCMGNICRSPAAEIVFRKLVEDAGEGDWFEIDSAGTIGFHAGKPPDSRMAEKLRLRGYECYGQSRKVTPSDLKGFDLILTMDEENFSDLLAIKAQKKCRAEIVPFVEHLTEYTAERIPDPYYGGEKGFTHVIDLLEDGCASLLEKHRRR